MAKVKIDRIEMDTSIQCRAAIDTGIVNEYAERMESGDKFPPVELFGNKDRLWIGDGWHRVMAANQIGVKEIPANVHSGGRVDALKCALSANAVHGHRRTNADKRRCVEIALKEFPKLSSRAIAEMAGVSTDMVIANRPQPSDSDSSRRVGKDGKERPAYLGEPKIERKEDDGETLELRRELGPPSNGMQYARMAVMDLESIKDDDLERQEALDFVKGWIKDHESKA
jgi:hypothetical protein